MGREHRLVNLSCMVLEVFRVVPMFSGGVPPDGRYELNQHLAEILNTSKPFPRRLLVKGNRDIVQDLFDDDGNMKDSPSINRPRLS